MNRRNFIKNTSAAGILASSFPYYSSGDSSITNLRNSSGQQPYRQIHLDFHTTEKIDNIGIDFNQDEFAETLKGAHVNSINCFAKGHHGWLYYNSKRFPDRVHPNLKTNLLKLQADALRKRDIKVIAYVSLQADLQTAIRHPEWRGINPDGTLDGGTIGGPSFWKTLCLNTPYVEQLKLTIQDVIENADVDGFWLDIMKPKDCSCKWCKERMQKRGLDINNATDRLKNGEEVIEEFTTTISGWIRSFNPNYLIYYNSGHVCPYHRKVEQNYTHFELESLSSSQKWGYPFFQNEARYARGLGKEFVGMTGKFHAVWGDFHSFKNKYALEFDCFQSLALNGKCCVGDQLHPTGKIDPVTYDLIGSVYRQVEEKEPWCEGAESITEIAVYHEEEQLQGIVNSHPTGLWGASKILLEGGFQYDVVDSYSDISKYKVVILPDRIPVSENLKVKLESFVRKGGSIIISFESGMDAGKKEFVSPVFGVKKNGEGPLSRKGEVVRGLSFTNNEYAQYIIPEDQIGKGLPKTEHVMHMRGMDIQNLQGSEVLIYNTLSYFDREGDYFISHCQTPSSGKQGLPAIVKTGRVIYFSHPVFSQYEQNAAPWCKTLVHNAIDILMPDRLLITNGPTTLLTSLNRQVHKNRLVAHFLHYIPMQRGRDFQTVEEVIPLYNLMAEIEAGKQILSVKLVPQNEELKFTSANKRIKFEIPKLEGHQMVEINYA